MTEPICPECLAQLRTAVRARAAAIYPKLLRDAKLADGRPASKSFEAFCEALLKDELQRTAGRGPGGRRPPARRTEMLRVLPRTIAKEQLAAWRSDAVCALTGSAEGITLDHFIPLEWGHGGVYPGNLFFVRSELNAVKSNLNPFRWINKLKPGGRIDMASWDRLVKRLATDNGLSVKAFRQYVLWCEKHKRTREQILADNGTSLELWTAYRGARPEG